MEALTFDDIDMANTAVFSGGDPFIEDSLVLLLQAIMYEHETRLEAAKGNGQIIKKC